MLMDVSFNMHRLTYVVVLCATYTSCSAFGAVLFCVPVCFFLIFRYRCFSLKCDVNTTHKFCTWVI